MLPLLELPVILGSKYSFIVHPRYRHLSTICNSVVPNLNLVWVHLIHFGLK